MSKEISLETLAATSKPTQKPIEHQSNPSPADMQAAMEKQQAQTAPQPVEQSKPQNVQPQASDNDAALKPQQPTEHKPGQGPKMGSGGLKKGVKFDANQVTSELVKEGVIQPKQEEVEEHPIVQSAFESMLNTINEKKAGAEKLLETMKANAEEDALDAELEGGVPMENSGNIVNMPQQQQNKARTQEEEDFAELDEPDEPAVQPVKSLNEVPKSISQYNLADTDNTVVDNAKSVEKAEQKTNNISVENKPETTKYSRSQVDKENEEFDKLINKITEEENENTDTAVDETGAELMDRLKSSMKNVKINQDQIDLSKFTIKQKPISSSFILNNLQSSNRMRKADWALYYTKRPMTFCECNGLELDTLRHTMENANDLNRVVNSLRFIYDHVVDANKPSFESWCKIIRTEDLDTMFYGIYKACYADSNLLARTCTADACHKTSLIETDINAMVKYGREGDDPKEIKHEFDAILHGDTTTETDIFKSTLTQISDDFVVAYSPATLYSTFIVYATLRSDITSRYTEDLSTMSYIDNFFYIDRNNSELVPIEIKEYPGNLNKTVLSRLKVYREIRKSLTNDQYNAFMAKLGNLIDQNQKVYYVMPECKCPECGATMPEVAITDGMLNMLFTRAQLARIRSL